MRLFYIKSSALNIIMQPLHASIDKIIMQKWMVTQGRHMLPFTRVHVFKC